MRVNDSSFSKTFGILQNWFTSGKTIDYSGKGFGFGLYLFVYLVKRPLIISSILRIVRQSAKCLNSYLSSCSILQTTCLRSSVTPTLAGPGGRRPPGMWCSRSRPPAVVVETWLEGHTRGVAPGVAPPSPTARLGHPGDVHSGLLKLISFFRWLRNGPIVPKVSYPNKKGI